MIEVALNDVHINFGFRQVLKGVGFEIQTGEKAAIVGSNGSGKTTIFRAITGREACDKGFSTVRKAATIGYLEQDTDVGGKDLTVEGFLKEAQKPVFDVENRLRELEMRMSSCTEADALEKLLSEYDRMQNKFIALNGYETDESFSKICTAFKIDDTRLAQKCAELSGGQKTVIKLARILLQAPDILLLDEPTNHLDIGMLQWLEDFIRDYRGTVVIVSHDRYFLDKTVRKTILLDQGVAEVFHGNYSFCLKEQERIMMEEFERYKNQQKAVEAMKAAIKRFREWAALGNNERLYKKAANMEKRLERMEMVDKPQLEPDKLPLEFSMGKRSGKRVLTIEELDFSYEGNELFKGAHMEMLFKDKVCLMGDNGVGKTTLVRLILGEQVCQSGRIALGESTRIGYIEQETTFADESGTVLSALREDAVISEGEARRILAKFFFCGDDVYKRLHSLSGGERVILRLAMLMQREVNLLILDEPTNHLDIDTKELLEESLSDYQGTLLFISHDRYFINKIATRIICVEDKGLKAYDGNYDYYLSRNMK